MSALTPLRSRTTNDGWSSQATTPLRIAKRDEPTTSETAPTPRIALPRRNSSSWKHVVEGGRVSKSPFKLVGKSSIPMPTRSATTSSPVRTLLARRASGEKRPRPPSMSESAENEYPAVRKRRQSQGLQGLVNRKPVSKSPFKSVNTEDERAADEHDGDAHDKDDLPPPPPPKERFDTGRHSPLPHRGSPSPVRPSLVSRRLHGPRTSSVNKRQRRKTVTFDPNCDVVEYDVDEDSGSQPFEWVTDEDDDNDDIHDRDDNDNDHDNPPPRDAHDPDDHNYHDHEPRGPLRVHNADESDDEHHVGDDSITGLVESMLEDARPQTPPHEDRVLPEDLETEAGVPYGRTHHAERLANAHHEHQAQAHPEEEPVPFHISTTATSTPDHSRSGTPIDSVSPGSHIPLGRSTHSERVKAQKETDVEDDVTMLPPSPSPAKLQTKTTLDRTEGLIPRFSLDVPKGISSPSTSFDATDPFGGDHGGPDLVGNDEGHDHDDDAPNRSDVSLSGVVFDMDFEKAEPRSSTESSSAPSIMTPPTSPPRFGMSHGNASKDSLLSRSLGTNHGNGSRESLLGRAASPTNFMRSGSPAYHSPFSGSPSLIRPPSRSGSPFLRGDSPLQRGVMRMGSSNDIESPNASPGNGRSPRITRAGVAKILGKKRSFDSPLREKPDSPFAEPSSVESNHAMDTASNTPSSVSERKGKRSVPSRIPAPKLTRDNPTFDGVLELDPEPQPGDPPRPSVAPRAASFDVNAEGKKADPEDLGFVHLGDMRSALDRLMADVAGEAHVGSDGKSVVGLKVEAVTEGIKAGRHSLPETEDVEMEEQGSQDDSRMDEDVTVATMRPPLHIELPSMGPESLLSTSFISPPAGTDVARPLSPQPPLVKDAIKTREELIKAKKREARRREEEMDEGEEEQPSVEYFTPRRPLPTRRRSLSTGDADAIMEQRVAAARRRANTISDGGLLDTVPLEEEDPLADSIDRELTRLKGGHSKYHVRQRSETIYASSETGHGSAVEDNAAKAWRMVRRPSDMNEYSQQLKLLRAQENSGKSFGKVFVKVLGVKNLNLPLPQQATTATCTLNNGIHFVTTPEFALGRESRIDQEFELIEHSKLEFTLTIQVRRDPHIMAQFKANTHVPPPPPQPIPPPASKGGLRSFFHGGSKKPQKVATPPPPRPVPKPQENLARYLKPDGVLARSFIAFKDIARRCDTKLFETSYPLIGQKTEAASAPKPMQIGEIVLQIFRLPPLPGIPPEQLPQSLEDCHRGLRHVQWHKVTYYEGTLTQNGGDCTSWRRRHFRVIGSNLVAFNDVTKKATATIDLRKALAVEDDEITRNELLSPASAVSARSSRYVEFDVPYGVERSFRLIFPDDQEIIFFADTDEEKDKWMEVLSALVGRIPPNPLWAELLWQRQQELAKQPQQPPPPATSRLSPIPG